MTNKFENDVREALDRQAQSVPKEAIERLQSIDYRPTTHAHLPLRTVLTHLVRIVFRARRQQP